MAFSYALPVKCISQECQNREAQLSSFISFRNDAAFSTSAVFRCALGFFPGRCNFPDVSSLRKRPPHASFAIKRPVVNNRSLHLSKPFGFFLTFPLSGSSTRSLWSRNRSNYRALIDLLNAIDRNSVNYAWQEAVRLFGGLRFLRTVRRTALNTMKNQFQRKQNPKFNLKLTDLNFSIFLRSQLILQSRSPDDLNKKAQSQLNKLSRIFPFFEVNQFKRRTGWAAA